MKENTYIWERNIFKIGKTTGKHTQESYVAVVREIQSERIFLQHVTKNTGDAFVGGNKNLQETVSSELLFRMSKFLGPIIGTISVMSVKKPGLGLQNHVMSENLKNLSSRRARIDFI